MNTAIILVDIQNDFLPGGAIGVPNGYDIIPSLNRLLGELKGRALVYTTQDWHPLDHSSFAINGGRWPVHCVAGSKGASLYAGLAVPSTALRIYKGTERDREELSGFEAGLGAQLKEAGIESLYIAGLAIEYCVKATALDALKLGYSVFLVDNGMAGMDKNESLATLEILRKAGAHSISA